MFLPKYATKFSLGGSTYFPLLPEDFSQLCYRDTFSFLKEPYEQLRRPTRLIHTLNFKVLVQICFISLPRKGSLIVELE